jgi:hypothetical protein
MAEDLESTIRENAAGPKRAAGDSGSVPRTPGTIASGAKVSGESEQRHSA